MFQNQPFIDPLQNRCYWIIDKIHRKKPVLESLFNKSAVLRTCNFIKEDYDTGTFYKMRLQQRCFHVVVQRCSVKRVFLEISQNSQETPVPESLF